MKAFNLQEALAGKPVVTRDGRKVTKLEEFPTGSEYTIYATVERNSSVLALTRSGSYFAGNQAKASDYDLFMDTTKKQAFVNIYPNNPKQYFGTHNGEIAVGNVIFNTLEEAKKVGGTKALTTVTIEYEV